MKPLFHASPVNGPFGDPALLVRILHERRALLFDAGDLSALGMADLLKISDLFVTHMHIDHFIGFDQLLRVILRRETPLRVFGPPGILDAVEGKLKGYTWNLIRDYPVRIEVFEIGDDSISSTSLYGSEAFVRIDRPAVPRQETILGDGMLKVRAITLDHQIPVLAYTLEEDFHININKAELDARSLPVGPWLGELKRLIRQAADHDAIIGIDGREFTLGELLPLAMITKGQKIAYVTDVAPDEENVTRIVPFVRGADTLYCEAYFLNEDVERARERSHLTAALAGRIAREAGVGRIEVMHISPKYMQNPEAIYEEAAKSNKK
jgi:ribonuclease Z